MENSQNALTYYKDGNALIKLSKYEDAIACYNQAIALDEKYLDA